ncbi:MAG: hypothetical protein ABJA67_07145 [Chthonomonadales bacterium]
MAKTISCPLHRNGLNPLRLHMPSSRHDVRRILATAQPPFETIAAARNEDSFRAQQLMKLGSVSEIALAELLDQANLKKEHLLTCASSFHMRQGRIRLSGEVMRLVVEAHESGEEVVAFTCVPEMWSVPELSWGECNNRRYKAQFRRWLERARVAQASGFIYSGFHGEWNGKRYQHHIHGIAVGEKAIKLRGLYGRFGLVKTDDIRAPLQIVDVPITEDLTDLAKWITYCLQSWWPYRALFVNAEGKVFRSRHRQRLPEAQHLEFLNFMARHGMGDLLFLNGIKLAKDRLIRI